MLLVMASHKMSPRGIFRTKKTETTLSLMRDFHKKTEKVVITQLMLDREPCKTLLSVNLGLKAALKVERRERARSRKEDVSCFD